MKDFYTYFSKKKKVLFVKSKRRTINFLKAHEKEELNCAKFIRRACINTSLKDLKKYYGVCFMMVIVHFFQLSGV